MKKIAKLSLVAAVAVAGLTTANAKPLEEAIKNVDVSGNFRYRMQDKDNAATAPWTEVEVEVGAKVKVTDNVKAVFKIDSDPDKSDANKTKDELKIEDYYFSYSKGAVTFNFGQQNIPTRMVDGVQGDGGVLLYKVSDALTVGGAAFINNSATTANDVVSVLATGKASGISYLAQWAEIADVRTGVNVRVAGAFSGVKASAEHTTRDDEAVSGESYSTTQIFVSAKAGKVAVTGGYIMTGEDGSGSLDQGALGASELTGFQLHSAGRADFKAVLLKATVPVMPKTSVTAYYAGGETGAAGDSISEAFGQVTYKAAKNLTTYARYGVLTGDAVAEDVARMRVEVKYSF